MHYETFSIALRTTSQHWIYSEYLFGNGIIEYSITYKIPQSDQLNSSFLCTRDLAAEQEGDSPAVCINVAERPMSQGHVLDWYFLSPLNIVLGFIYLDLKRK